MWKQVSVRLSYQVYWEPQQRKKQGGGGQNKISNSCQSSEDLDEMFTLKMGMMQTGPLVGFGHRPLNKFQL